MIDAASSTVRAAVPTTEVQGGGGLRLALLPARLLQLVGAGQLSSVHAIMDWLRGSPRSAGFATLDAVRSAIAEQVPALAGRISPADLADQQSQDLPLALLLLTHPALPRRAAPLLMLRTLAGWPVADLAHLYGMTPERVMSKLNAGARRIRILQLGVSWPHLRELSWRIKHSIEVIEQLHATGRNRRSQRLGKTAACEYASDFLEALALNPITQSPWALERWWHIRYDPQPFLLQGGTTPFIRA